MRGYRWAWLVIASTAVWVPGCGNSPPPSDASSDAPPVRTLSRGDVATVVRGSAIAGPAISGVLTPAVVIDIKAKMVGDIASVTVQEGTVVRKGQSLATMDTDELGYRLRSAEAELAAAEAMWKNARQHLERSRRLLAEGAIAPRDLDSAQAEADAGQAEVSLRLARVHELRKTIADAAFPSPIDGIVSRRLVEPGDHVDDGDVLLTVVDPDIIELTAAISSEDLGRIRIGLPIVCRVEGYKDRTFEGAIARINPGADPVTRQVTVYVRIPNEKRDLIGGLFATGRIVTEQADAAIMVPADALRSEAGGTAVYRIDQGVVTGIPVTVVLRDEATGMVAVSGDLQEGDLILAGPVADIPSGTRVALAAPDSTERR